MAGGTKQSRRRRSKCDPAAGARVVRGIGVLELVRVAIVDDHEVVRMGLTRMFDQDPDVEVVSEAATCRDARVICNDEAAEVMLLDVRLPDGNGLDVCREFSGDGGSTRFVVLTTFADQRLIRDALDAGASGFILKDSPLSGIRNAVHSAASGQVSIGRNLITALTSHETDNASDGALNRLSDREREVLAILGDGLTNQEIAETLHLSLQTVKNYVSALLTKLGLSRRAEAAALVARLKAESEATITSSTVGLPRI